MSSRPCAYAAAASIAQQLQREAQGAEVVVAGSSLVGLAFDDSGNMIVVSTQKVYRVSMGIKGYSVF